MQKSRPELVKLIKEKLRIDYFDRKISIFWDNSEVTKGLSFNVAINTLGLWTDCFRADWEIIDKGKDYFRLKLIFKELPLSQVWLIRLEEDRIYWEINLEIEEWLHIDEFRISCAVSSCYKVWISGFQEKEFPRLTAHWQDLCSADSLVSFVGVRFATGSEELPSFSLESQNTQDTFSFIQNSPIDIDSHVIGFRKINSPNQKDYAPGLYQLFKGTLTAYKEDYLLDEKIEGFRQRQLEASKK